MNRNYVLFDNDRRNNLLPLTFTRPVSEIRIGILTIREKWEKYLQDSCTHLTVDYLREKYPMMVGKGDCCYINGGVLPNQYLLEKIINLKPGKAIVIGNRLVAGLMSKPFNKIPEVLDFTEKEELSEKPVEILNPWDIFIHNGIALEDDFSLLTKGRLSEDISKTNRVFDSGKIFIEKGAKVECSILNAGSGSIYIGANAEVMEGSIIRGPFAACDGSVIKMGAKIYGPTTIGPYSKVGGEINNSVIFANSNKAHDGFLGNSVLGEWCNLGADTNNSNLKNNYAEVKLWNYPSKGFIGTGLQFCGLIMGDHSKCGINTMFNTGTVVGVSANIFGSGFPRNFIPSFSWGGSQGFTVYQLNKVFETVEKVMKRRGIELTEVDRKILTHIFTITEEYRQFS